MSREVEFDYFTGNFKEVKEALNRSIGQYKNNYSTIKIGITGIEPQIRFNKHLAERRWKRMIVKYETDSFNFIKKMEKYLVDEHWCNLVNSTGGGGGIVETPDSYYLYFLLY